MELFWYGFHAGGRKLMGSRRCLALGVFLFFLSRSCAPGGKLLSLAVIITEICYNEPRNMEPCLLDWSPLNCDRKYISPTFILFLSECFFWKTEICITIHLYLRRGVIFALCQVIPDTWYFFLENVLWGEIWKRLEMRTRKALVFI